MSAYSIEQLALRLNTGPEEKGRRFGPTAEQAALDELVQSAQRGVSQTHHDDISPSGTASTETREQFLQFRKGGEGERSNVRSWPSAHNNYM
jgi:hypothetical protein